MLRAMLSEFKRVCTLAHFHRFRGDMHLCKINKISSVLMSKNKSTTTGSRDDDEEKKQKVKHLIELAFGPEKLGIEEGIEIVKVPVMTDQQTEHITQMVTPDSIKPDVASDKDNKIASTVKGITNENSAEKVHFILNASKVEDEEHVIKKIKESSFTDADKRKDQEVKVDTSLPLLFSKKNFSKRRRTRPSDNYLEKLDKPRAAPNDNSKVLDEMDKLGLSQNHLKDITHSPVISTDAVTMDSSKDLLFSKKHFSKRRRTRPSDNYLEKLDKPRAAPNDNSKVLDEMDKLGLSQNHLKDITHSPVMGTDAVTMDSSKDIQKPGRKSEIELETRVLEKDKIKMSRINFINRRAIKHLALHMNTDDISKITSKNNKSSEDNVQKNNNLPDILPERLVQDRNFRGEQEIVLIHEKPQNVTESVEKVESAESKETGIVLSNKLKNDNIKNLSEPVISTKEEILEGPAVLVKQSEDPDGFKITPETPRAATLTDQLIALNARIQQPIDTIQAVNKEKLEKEALALENEIERTKFKKEMTSEDKIPCHLLSNLTVISNDSSKGKGKESQEVAQPKGNKEEIPKIFADEKVPYHLLSDLTIVAKELPNDAEIRKVIENFFEQDYDSEITLIKPDRSQFNLPNDDIVEDRDYSLELNPRVVVKDYVEPEPPDNSELYNPPEDPYNPPQNPYNLPQNPYRHHPYNFSDHISDQNNMFPRNPGQYPYQGGMPHNMNFSEVATTILPKEANRYSSDVPSTSTNDLAPDHTSSTKCVENTSNTGNMTHPILPYSTFEYTDSQNKGSKADTQNKKEDYEFNTSNKSQGTANKSCEIIQENVKPDRMQTQRSAQNESSEKVKENLKLHIMAGLPAETAGCMVNDSFKPMTKIVDAKAGDNSQQNTLANQNRQKAPANAFLGPVTTTSIRSNAYLNPQEPVRCSQIDINMPSLNPHDRNITLSEMLRRVRLKARLETIQQLMVTSSATSVEPARDSKKAKPSCPSPDKNSPTNPKEKTGTTNPKDKTSTTNPKKSSSSDGSEKTPCPNPCKPACPEPCVPPEPRCPGPTKKDKKDPSAKMKKHERTFDILGLVVTLGPIYMPEISTENKPTDKKQLPKEDRGKSLVIEDIYLRLNALVDNIIMPEIKENPLLEAVMRANLHDTELFNRVHYFPKNYDPWTPIPSWPIPVKNEKKKVPNPKDGCKMPGPSSTGFCNNIHHPCRGFPNPQKKT